MSFFNASSCADVRAPEELSYTTASLSVILAFVTTTGNVLVLLAIVIDPNKDLRSPFNYFVANLALADLIVGLILDPISVAIHIEEGLGVAIAGTFKLYLIHMTYFISCTASLLSLTALTIDRFIAITSPLTYRLKLNPLRAAFVSAGIWIFSLSFPFVYFKVGYITYAFVFANTAIAATFFVLLLTYLKIFKSFRAEVKQWDDLHDSSEENQAKKQAVKWEKKITKTLMILLALFIACYLPSCILIYVMNLCTSCSCIVIHWSRDFQFLFVLVNSGMNPFVYGWRLKPFRKAFKKLVRCDKSSRHRNTEYIPE